MVNKIEMSLDEIIKSQKSQRGGHYKSNGSGGSRGEFRQNRGGPSDGGVIKGRNRGGIHKTTMSKVNRSWKHDKFEGSRKNQIRTTAGHFGGVVGCKLIVSNLDVGVSESNIRELFVSCGELVDTKLNYTRSGKSLGTADVVFERRTDAINAMQQYNGVRLDGQPMGIQLATTVIPATQYRVLPQFIRQQSSGGGSRGAPRSRNQVPRREKGRFHRRQQRETKTAEELDAELDSWMHYDFVKK